MRDSSIQAGDGHSRQNAARWAREGKLSPLRTPGGHRRYSLAAVRQLMAEEATPREAERQVAEDAARLYEQGWSIRQVAGKFDYSYGAMRRLLRKHVTLRNRGGTFASVHLKDRT